MKIVLLAFSSVLFASSASAFCGFYVAKADSKLFNKSSQVCLVRDGNHTVLTMANDFQGDPKEFAMVIPVPTVIKEKDVKVVEKALLDHVDAYTAPRLVEYWDGDPNNPPPVASPVVATGSFDRAKSSRADGARALGVKFHAEAA